ncbi:hypothetical protein ACW0JT_17635 [Arthrobacter sp. SA17]
MGARQSITGCLVRIVGFLLLAWAADFPLFLIGAIVTGIGGALFSPAVQSLVDSAAERGTIQKNDQERTAQDDDNAHKGDERQNNRATLFALMVVCGEVGWLLVRCWDLSYSIGRRLLPLLKARTPQSRAKIMNREMARLARRD